MRLLLALLCLPLLALDNVKTIHNNTASALTSYPFTLHYYLAQGEVASYPRPYATPSDTSVRAAVTNWQADVKSRYRDGSRVRPITGVLSGDPWWATGGNGLVSIVVASNIATVTTTSAHGLNRGDRVVISLATVDNDLNRDHYTVIETPATPTTFRVRTQSVANGTYSNAGLTVTHIIDPWASGQCRIKAPSHGLEVSEDVTVAGVDGMAGVNGTFKVSAVSRDELLLNTTCSGVYLSGGTITGPDFGSVRAAHVSFIATVPASGSLAVDVVNSSDACHLGSATTCRDSAPTSANVLDQTWNGHLDATAVVVAGSTATKSASARTMLAAWDGSESYCGTRYWLRGPVVVQLLVEDACTMAYDFGWKTVMSATAVAGNTITTAIDAMATTLVTSQPPNFTVGSRLYWANSTGTVSQTKTTETMLVTSIVGNTITVTRGYEGSTAAAYAVGKGFGVLQYEDSADPTFKGLHPSFAITYYPGWSGVKVETRVENPYWEKMASIWYAPTIRTGAGLAVRWSRGETVHGRQSRWRKVFWDGSDPEHYCTTGGDPDGACVAGVRAAVYRVDHNRKYLEYAGALQPRIDVDVSTTMDHWVNGYDTSNGFRYGWHYTDKGDYGVAKKLDANALPPAASLPYLYPGEGNVNNEIEGNWAAARDWSSDDSTQGWQSAEGWWPMPTDSLWLHTDFSAGGYEMSLGTSVPGGGGNSAVEGHISMFLRDGAARIYVAGWPDLGTGRNLSLHSRPNITALASKMYSNTGVEDAFVQACVQTPTAAPVSAAFYAQVSWPCNAGENSSHASDPVSGLEPGHLPDYQSLPWIITGDEWWWQGLMMKAGWSATLGYNTPLAVNTRIGRNRGKIHADSYVNGHIRMRAWPELASTQALMATPTESLFGQAYIPERTLFNAYLWDYALHAEGAQGKMGGWAQTLYPVRWTSDCTGFSALPTASTSSDRYRTAKCGMNGANANGYFDPQLNVVNTYTSYPTVFDLTKVNGNASLQYIGYEANVMTHARDIGAPQYRYAREALAKWWLNGVLNRNTNPFLLSDYVQVDKLINSPIGGANQRPQSWAEFYDAYTTLGKAKNAWSTGPIGFGNKIIAPLMMLWDSMADATTPGCTPADRPPIGCTGAAAVAFAEQSRQGQDAISTDPRWAGVAPRPYITHVQANWAAGVAALSWVAPDGASCTVAFNPANSLAGYRPDVMAYVQQDVAATVVAGRLQSLSWETAAGSTYRITCGQARVTGVL